MDIKRIETLTESELLSEGQVARLRAREVYVPDMSSAVGRLEHLKHIVRGVPDAQFSIDAFDLNDCGTVGCIAWWATYDSHFQKRGASERSLGWSLRLTNALDLPGPTPRDLAWHIYTSTRHSGEPRGASFTKAHAIARIDHVISTLAATP